MQNPIIPSNEVTLLKEIISKCQELSDTHEKNGVPNFEDTINGGHALKVHTLLFLRAIKDLYTDINNIANLIDEEMSEAEFIEAITQNGERTIEEVERKLVLGMFAEILDI